jgi:hypothetical protein
MKSYYWDREAATVPGARVHLFLNAEIRIGSEMEFSDIILTKGLSLLLNAIHSPYYWRILKKIKLFFLWF